METDCGVAYEPGAGENVGVAACTVYVALAMELPLIFVAVAIALMVVVALNAMGAVYFVDEVVGVLPSVV